MSEGDAFLSGRVDADEEAALSGPAPFVETGVRYADRDETRSEPSSSSYPPSRYGPVERGVTRARAALFGRRQQIARLWRYAATSVIAFGLSEAILLILCGTGTTGATVGALIANVATTIPSYLMSRYWIWKDAERSRVGRQVVLYWATSAASIILTSLATGALAKLIPVGQRFHLVLIGVAFLVVNVFFWFAKFVVYHKFIFPSGSAERAAPSTTV